MSYFQGARLSFEYESHKFEDAGWCPNNPKYPLLVYRRVNSGNGNLLAEWFDTHFDQNGWIPAWRYTIYDFAHFHSNTHEVVGAYQGTATVQFGDTAGYPIELSAGEVVLILWRISPTAGCLFGFYRGWRISKRL